MKRVFIGVICALLLAATPLMAKGLADEVIYFVMLDRFADGDSGNNQGVDSTNPLAFQGGDLRGLTQKLPYIADLGATAIWITPVVQQIEGSIKAENGLDFYPHHGYWASDVTKLDRRYGSEDDLKALVEAAHARGIKILLDVVYNHLGYGMESSDSAGWLRKGAECGSDPVTLCLSGLPDYKTELPEVRRYLFDAYIGLAERTGLDGFRLDTFKHVSHDFWQAHRTEVDRRLGKNFILIGEIWDGDRFLAKPYFKGDEANAIFDFSFRDRVLKFLSGVYDGAKLGRYLAARHDVQTGYYLAPFLSNHDMSMMLAMLRGDKQRLAIAATLLMSAEGPPVLTWGEEIGRRGGVWPDNREGMDWNGPSRDDALRDIFKRLITVRKATPDLRGSGYKVLYSDKEILVYQRGENAIVAISRSDAMQAITLDGVDPAAWHLAFSSVEPAGDMTSLPAGSGMIFLRN